MRYASIASLLALTIGMSTASAQTPQRESALGSDLGDFGGFIGLDTRFGDMMNDFAVFMGAHAALLLKHRVYIGLSGAGLVTNDSRVANADGSPEIDMGYGGLLLGHVVNLPSLVQFTIDVVLGGGAVRLRGTPETDEWDRIFVFMPSVGAEIKLARVLRLGFGAGYRFTGAVDTEGLRDSDLRGFAGTATLRVGWF